MRKAFVCTSLGLWRCAFKCFFFYNIKRRRTMFREMRYNEVEKFDYMEFNKVLDTFSNHSTTIINYFEERLTNASAESFNAKIKAFRSQLRGGLIWNSSCSDWLGYTLKRKLTNPENPLTLKKTKTFLKKFLFFFKKVVVFFEKFLIFFESMKISHM